MSDILVLYWSRKGATEALAREVCRGIDTVGGMSARLRTVPTVSAETAAVASEVPESGPPYATTNDLRECAGLVLGSPTNFGNMAASLKHFIDGTVGDWFSGILVDKPAGVFTSSASLHGGQESTLLTMALPLIHHGMLFVGVPYTEERLSTTTTGGTPYGASHVSRNNKTVALSDDEKQLARALGKRVATFAARLERKE
ncbi:MAG: NAD(P)H:quinone oxidoreductase [Gammaproteobacteria bacterium]|nr:NAD(P)H:quinone oxidoreductase [Gammaproteobacteria bacterium]